MTTPTRRVEPLRLRAVSPPVAVEQLIFDVRAPAFEDWKAADFELWTEAEAELSDGYLGKELWVQDRGDWVRVSVVIYWRALDDWLGLDAAWVEAQEAAFSARVGADNYRLVATGHEGDAHYFKISEYH